MSTIKASIIEKIRLCVLKRGKLPRHVAFVADGARRFGRKYAIPVQENHEIGLQNCMFEVIDWCLQLGIREYSILMFTFGNYYRPDDETQHWKIVLKIWLIKCIKNWRTLESKGIRFNFYGKLSLIPDEINSLMGVLQLITRHNNGVVVNMAMGYTSRHEMSTISFNLYNASKNGSITSRITRECFTECLFAVENRPVDLFIRTSGHKRISDFLNWQSSKAIVYFCDVLWPEFSRSNFLDAISYYGNVAEPTFEISTTNSLDDRNTLVYVKQWKNESRSFLYEYCVKMSTLPKYEDVEELYSYDYETIFHFFQSRYNVREW